MKKLFILFVGSCSLMACAALQPQPAFDWRGQNFDNYVLQYGVPTAQIRLQSGNVVYSFVKQCTYNSGQAETIVTVDASNTITSISQKGKCLTADEIREEYEYQQDLREKEIKEERRRYNEKIDEEREYVDAGLKVNEMESRVAQSELAAAEADLAVAQAYAKMNNATPDNSSIQKAEQNLKQAQTKSAQLNQKKENLERKKAQLEASYWR